MRWFSPCSRYTAFSKTGQRQSRISVEEVSQQVCTQEYEDVVFYRIVFGVAGGGSSRYAQIDIAATETAHKVGTQHAQCRQERLQELEHKRKGAQQ